MSFALWLLTGAVAACELAIPLAFCFWAGRRYERRLVERSLSAEASAWLDTHDRRPSLEP